MTTYPKGEVLGGEDTAQALFLVDDENTVGTFGSTELTGIGDAHALGHSEGRAGAESSNSALLGLFAVPLASLTLGLGLGSLGGLAALSRKLIFDLLAQRL